MKTVRSGLFTGLLALSALALVAPTAPLHSQDVEVETCRCVDRDGNEIENCTCFRAPDLRGIVTTVGPWGETRPRLGISVDVGQSSRLDARGVRVTDVMDDGPAAEAGLQVGDVVTAIGGHSLFDPLDAETEQDFDLDQSVPVQRLLAISRELEQGQEVEVELLRDGERRTVTVVAEELPAWGTGGLLAPRWDAERMGERMRDLADRMETWEYRFDRDDAPRVLFFDEPGSEMRLRSEAAPEILFERLGGTMRSTARIAGVEFMDMRPGLAGFFGVEDGVLVTDVDDDSTLGVEPGDVILRIGERDVTSASQLRRILRSYEPDEEITLHVRRDGRDISVAGRLD